MNCHPLPRSDGAVLPAYRSVALGIYAVCPSRHHVSPKVRLLIDFLVQAFASPPWDV